MIMNVITVFLVSIHLNQQPTAMYTKLAAAVAIIIMLLVIKHLTDPESNNDQRPGK